jgi:hypothetical protein
MPAQPIAFERSAKKAQVGHGLDQFAGETAGAVALFDDGNEIVFDKFARGVAHQALVIVQQRVEFDEVNTTKFDGWHFLSLHRVNGQGTGNYSK